jgi:hypothetical protein
VGRDSSGGIATRYVLEGPGIEPRGGRDFPHPSRPALGPTQPPIQWVPGFFPGVKRPGRGVDHQTPSSFEVKERVRPLAHTPAFCRNRFRLRSCSFSHVPALPLPVASLILNAAHERCLYTEIGSATCLCSCILGWNTKNKKKPRKTILDTSNVGCKIFGSNFYMLFENITSGFIP